MIRQYNNNLTINPCHIYQADLHVDGVRLTLGNFYIYSTI